MRFGTAFLAVIICASSLFATVPTPTNLTVEHKSDANGQYFHVTFRKCDPVAGATMYFHLYRWNGAVPDTSHKTTVASFSAGGDTIASYDDHNSAFNNASGSTFETHYSYAADAYLRDTTSGHPVYTTGDLTSLVTGTLDSNFISFTHIPSSVHVNLGDSVHVSFHAILIGDTNATIQYRLFSTTGPATGSIDSVTGDFDAYVPLTAALNSYTRFAIHAVDSTERYAEARFYVSVLWTRDSVTIVFIDGNIGSAVAGYTRVYTAVIPANSADTTKTTTYNGTQCDHYGRTVLVVDSGFYKIRAQVEGYKAQWINDVHGNATIGSGGTVYDTVWPASTMTISGKATGPGDTALANATIFIGRAWNTNHYSLWIDTTYTDANGEYSIAIPEGDSILGTDGIYAEGYMTGFTDSIQWYDHTGYSSKTRISLSGDKSGINFSFLTRIVAHESHGYFFLQLVDANDDSLAVYAQLTTYRIVDTGVVTYHVDTIYHSGYIQKSLPVGHFVFFAIPWDTTYLSGYYHDGSYAGTWGEADTVSIASAMVSHLRLVLQRDSNVVRGGGTPIGGAVTTPRGPVPSAHLVLYRHDGEEGTPTSTYTLVSSAMTDANGMYQFNHIARGTYRMVVDLIGRPRAVIDGVVVDSGSTPIRKDIVLDMSDVNDPFASPMTLALAQNYPNPFTASTTIAFSTPARGTVELAIYDALGRQVALVPQGTLDAGLHFATLQNSLRSGTYICVLRAAGTTLSRVLTVR
jgi:hypothetical protein